MIKIILTLFFIANTIVSLYSMETIPSDLQENPHLFLIQTDHYNFKFSIIDLHNLEKHHQQTLQQELADFDAISSIAGYGQAIVSTINYFFYPEANLDNFTKNYDALYQKMPYLNKIMYHWVIEDQKNNNEYVGLLCITTYIDERPKNYENTPLLEVGLLISAQYRNKKITTTLASLVKKKLEAWAPFNNGIFCFRTRSDNQAIHKLALSQGAILIHTNQSYNLFIIEKK